MWDVSMTSPAPPRTTAATAANKLNKLNKSAVDIILDVAKATNSKEDAIAALRALANGEDGVPGTADDVIPQHVVDVIAFLIENGVAADIIALAPGGNVLALVARGVVALVQKLKQLVCRA